MSQYAISATLEFNVTVTVEAETAEEAQRKFDACDWEDDGVDGGELINWTSHDTPREEK